MNHAKDTATKATSRGSGGDAATDLQGRLAREERALTLRSLAAASAVGIAIVLAVLAGAAFALDEGRWMALPRIVPVFAWLLGLAGAVAVGVWLRRRDRARLNSQAIAISIEQEQALRVGSLRSALEVASTGALGARAAADIAGRLAPVAVLAPALNRNYARTALLSAGGAIAALLLFVLSARATDDGLAALRNPVAAWRGLLLPPLSFSNLPSDVPRGMPLTVHIDARGRHTIDVTYSAAGQPARDTTLDVDLASGQAALDLGPMTAPVTIVAGDGRSLEVSAVIAVSDRGWIGDIALFAEYPVYLSRTNERLEPVPPLRVPRGTVVRVTAMLRGGARDALLTNGTDTVALLTETTSSGDAVARGRIVAERDAEWRWVSTPTSRNGGAPLPVEIPDALAFTVVPDQLPRISIVSPASDTTIGVTGAIGVLLQGSDDHGLHAIFLSIWKERPGSPAGASERIAVADPMMPVWDGGATIALSGRELEPGDKLHIVAVAVDNSPWRQSSQSNELVLRVPSLSEQRAMARDLADSLASKAAQMAQEEKQLQQQTVNASRSRDLQGNGRSDGANSGGDAKSQSQKSQGTMSASAAERARDLARQQQSLGSRVDSLRQASKDLEDRLKSAGALDTAMQARMRDIQQMLRDAMTPEMQKQLAELQKNTDKLSGTEAQRSLEQLAQQQRQMREQLEKSAEMLKRAALEGAMQTLRDEAKELANEQHKLADRLKNQQQNQQGNQQNGQQSQQGSQAEQQNARELADRSRALERDVDKLAKRLDDEGAKPGASRTKAAQPMVDQAADAMQRAAQQSRGEESNGSQQRGEGQQAQQGQQQNAQQGQNQQQGQISQQGQNQQQNQQQNAQGAKNDSASRSAQNQIQKALDQLDQKDKDAAAQARAAQTPPPTGAAGSGSQAQRNQSQGAEQGSRGSTSQSGAGERAGQQQGGEQQANQGQQGNSQNQQGGQNSQQNSAQNAQQAASAMDRAAQQLADARDAQVNAWKGELSQQLDQSISETQQLARQQSELEQRARQEGAQGLRGEQSAIQQGVQQAAERLEQAGRSSSHLSQRSQRAMADAQRKVQDATQAASSAQQGGSGQEAAQNAMREATEALNQALGSLVRDRERVNSAQSASGFSEMMEQLKQLAQQQGSLNGQMQGLNLLPGGAQGQQAQQQARVLARQQREIARTLQDISDVDATGRTDALAKEAQQLAQSMERSGLDPSVAARQQQLYRRLLDAGRFLEQDERDEQGPREARSGSGEGRGAVGGASSGRNATKFAPPTWNELRGLGPEERRLVIEYFRRINGGTP